MRIHPVLRLCAAGVLTAAALTTLPTEASAATPMCEGGIYYHYAIVPGMLVTNSPKCHLSRGESGGAVWVLQETLNFCYHKGLAVDNSFGSLTQKALREVQAQIGVTADGDYGPHTRDAMLFKADTETHCTRI